METDTLPPLRAYEIFCVSTPSRSYGVDNVHTNRVLRLLTCEAKRTGLLGSGDGGPYCTRADGRGAPIQRGCRGPGGGGWLGTGCRWVARAGCRWPWRVPVAVAGYRRTWRG